MVGLCNSRRTYCLPSTSEALEGGGTQIRAEPAAVADPYTNLHRRTELCTLMIEKEDRNNTPPHLSL